MLARGVDQLRKDVQENTLPQVSWIVAPAALSEHPGASTPLQGADYTARVLDAAGIRVPVGSQCLVTMKGQPPVLAEASQRCGGLTAFPCMCLAEPLPAFQPIRA